MIFMILIVADSTDDAILNALRFKADQIQNLTDVVSTFIALGVLKLLSLNSVRHCNYFYRKRYCILPKSNVNLL